MLLFFNGSESLECTKVFFLKLTAILFYSEIHCKPAKSSNKSRRSIWIGTFLKRQTNSLRWHLPEGTPSSKIFKLGTYEGLTLTGDRLA